jgi:hypothetical protein
MDEKNEIESEGSKKNTKEDEFSKGDQKENGGSRKNDKSFKVSKKKKEAEVSRIPLPLHFQEERKAEDVSELDPNMTKMLTSFKQLCGLSSVITEEFIQVAQDDNVEEETTASEHYKPSCKLVDNLTLEDRYMMVKDDMIQRVEKKDKKIEDYSGAKPAVITEKVGKKKLKKLRRQEREKTKGKDWFDMPAPEMTEERKLDLELLQMRGALDPKRFYKRSDMRETPKYFQIGTVVDSPYDFYSDRIPTKARKRTMVDELLADAEFKRYNKRKYVQIIESQPKMRHSKAKRNKDK